MSFIPLILVVSAAFAFTSPEVGADAGFISDVSSKQELPGSSAPADVLQPYQLYTLQQHALGILPQGRRTTLQHTVLPLAAAVAALAAVFVILKCYKALGSARNVDSKARRLADDGNNTCEVGCSAVFAS